MNTIVTSKEEILKNSRELIREKGWAAVSIRSVASACGVSGRPRSTTIMTPRLSLSAPRSRASGAKFSTARRTRPYFRTCRPVSKWMYERMAYGCEQYPGFFTLHPLGFMQEDKADGKRHMQQIWHHILNGLCTVPQQDTKIRPDAFNEQFTVEKICRCSVFAYAVCLLRQDYDPAAVLEIVRRTLY